MAANLRRSSTRAVGCLLLMGIGFCASLAAGQIDCLRDADGDGHPLFGMMVEHANQPWGVGGPRATSIALADLDGDGDLDAVVAMAGQGRDAILQNSYVSILLNRGDGVYDRGEYYDAGLEETMVELADMDGDGILDIVVAAASSDEVGVLLGRSDGTFAEAMLFPAGDEPRSVAIADFDGDGILDVATLNTLSGDISILAGNGDGTLAPERRVDPGGSITPRGDQNRTFPWPGPFVAAGDIDGDGDADLALPRVTHIGFLLNDGAGNFTPSAQRVPGPMPYVYAVELHDIDGDGDLDALAGVLDPDRGESWLVVGLNAGDGTFATSHYDASIAGPGWNYWSSTLAVGDVDADGDDDVVMGNWAIRSALLLRNHGNGTFAPVERIEQTVHPWVVALGDANGDGELDLFMTRDASAWLHVSPNDGRGGFIVPEEPESDIDPLVNSDYLQVSDFDGDGVLDALVLAKSNQQPADAWLLLGSAGPRFSVSDVHDFGIGDMVVNSTGLGDIDGDGLDDFILTAQVPWNTADADGIVWVAINPGDGSLGNFQRFDLPHARSRSTPVVADFNGDGHNDLAVHEGESMFTNDPDRHVQRRVTIFLNDGNGLLSLHQRLALWSGPRDGAAFGGLAATDLDADGDLDLVSTSEITRTFGNLCLLENDGSGTFAVASCEEIPNSPRGLVVRDLDGDGVEDAAVMHAFDQEDSPYLSIYRGDGRGRLIEDQAYFDPHINPRGDFRSADFNNDGAPDLFFPILDGNAVVVHLNDGRGGFDSRAMYASRGLTPPQALAAADFTGDGHTDILANQVSDGEQFRLFRNVACLCRADLDGDGALDADDFFLYLDLFAAADPRADFTRDGTIDVTDFFAFLDAFTAGCG